MFIRGFVGLSVCFPYMGRDTHICRVYVRFQITPPCFVVHWVTIRVHIKVFFLFQTVLSFWSIRINIRISVIVYYVPLIWGNTHL